MKNQITGLFVKFPINENVKNQITLMHITLGDISKSFIESYHKHYLTKTGYNPFQIIMHAEIKPLNNSYKNYKVVWTDILHVV